MGVENNEVVIATTWNAEEMQKVRDWVSRLAADNQKLFAFVPSLTNGYETVFMGPDGSKKGWETSERLAIVRGELIALIETFKYEDGSSPWDWVEVGYGEFGQKVLQGNCKNMYSDEPYATR